MPPLSDVHLQWDVKHLTLMAREKMLQHAGGPLPYVQGSPARSTIRALVNRKMLRMSCLDSKTEPTAYGARVIECLVAKAMQLEQAAAPALVPAAPSIELERA